MPPFNSLSVLLWRLCHGNSIRIATSIFTLSGERERYRTCIALCIRPLRKQLPTTVEMDSLGVTRSEAGLLGWKTTTRGLFAVHNSSSFVDIAVKSVPNYCANYSCTMFISTLQALFMDNLHRCTSLFLGLVVLLKI